MGPLLSATVFPLVLVAAIAGSAAALDHGVPVGRVLLVTSVTRLEARPKI